MSIRIAPIVEGHGEVEAVRILLTRTWNTFVNPGEYPDVIQPIRVSKSKIIREDRELLRAVDLASLKLNGAGLVLLLMDADDDAACSVGPTLVGTVAEQRSHINFACVLAVVEYETWFVAAAESLADSLRPEFATAIPADPESERSGKGWIQAFFKGTRYSETIDQPRLTARMDLHAARAGAPSFDKLCRELEKRATGPIS